MFLSNYFWLNWLQKQYRRMKRPILVTNWFSTCFNRMTVICSILLNFHFIQRRKSLPNTTYSYVYVVDSLTRLRAIFSETQAKGLRRQTLRTAPTLWSCLVFSVQQFLASKGISDSFAYPRPIMSTTVDQSERHAASPSVPCLTANSRLLRATP